MAVVVDSMLQFQIKMGGDGMKHCQKMKRMQRARLVSMGKKRDTAQRRNDVGRSRGGTEEAKGSRPRSWTDTNLTDKK
jgi:hypothetical protein